MQPAGVKIIEIKPGGNVTIGWSRVILNNDRTVYKRHGSYKVYRTYDPSSGWSLIYTTTSLKDSYRWTDISAAAGYTIFYKVVAVDKLGNAGKLSMAFDTTDKRNLIATSADGRAEIEIPYEISSKLYKENNSSNEDMIIEIVPAPTGDNEVLAGYRYWAISAKSGKEVETFKFDKPKANIVFKYLTSNGDISGAPGSVSVREEDKQLAIYWYNGIEWIKFGGKVDSANDKVTVMTKSLGSYALKLSYRPGSFEITDIQPDKIFTPKSQFTNFIEFKYDNPLEARVIGKIYDIRGAFVSSMNTGNSTTVGDISGSLLWNGKYSAGRYAPAGVYIYQIEVTGTEEKLINGTVIIAR
jgi:hypothetical protein